MIYGQLPFGVWGIAETHLAQPGLRSTRSAFHRAGREYNRHFAVLPGALVPLRSTSESAGTWAGVMTIGDLIPRPVHVNWPNNEYLDGRVQLTECWLGPFSFTGAMLYGWPSGPTYPQALHDTNAMLETVIKEVVISKTGPRYIMGDSIMRLRNSRQSSCSRPTAGLMSKNLGFSVVFGSLLQRAKGPLPLILCSFLQR